MSRFVGLIPFEEALERIRFTKWNNVETERIRSRESSGRLAAEDIFAAEDFPKWNRSLVDGYAVRSVDCGGASETNPLNLKINGIVEAGSTTFKVFMEGHCTVIYTGGLIPPDYDSVIMAEDAEPEENSINIFKGTKPWENVERKGDDIRSGAAILKASELARPWHVSALVSSGVDEIRVFRKLRIGVLATGNELFPEAQGHIPNTTQNLFVDYLRRPFLEPETVGIAHDDVEEISRMAEKALQGRDCLIITGGTSLGGKDDVPEAISTSGNVIFAGSMIRPGRTLTLYEVEGKPVFSVSGIPVPSLLSFDVFFEEYLKTVLQLKQYRQIVTGKIVHPLTNKAGYAGIYRVRIIPSGNGSSVEIVKTKGTGTLSSILGSQGTLLVPGNVEGLEAGSTVQVKLFGDAV